MNKYHVALKLLLLLNLFISSSFAQVTVDSPATDLTIAPCDDYFSSKWAEELSMSGRTRHGDLLDNIPSEFSEIGAITYSGGIASIPATGSTPFFRLLSPADARQVIDDNVTRYGQHAPIDTNYYKYLSFRMKPGSPLSFGYSVRWDTCPTQAQGYQSSFTNLFETPNIWKDYTLDLSTASLGIGTITWASGEKCGMSLYPIRHVEGSTALLDWVQLTPSEASCSSAAVSYTAVGTDELSIFLDSDTNLSNGYEAQSSVSTGSGTKTFSSAKLFPGSYFIHAVQSPDWASLHRGDAWDMSDAGDINSRAGSGITLSGSDGFVGGQFCGTNTAGDPWLYLTFPKDETIDTAKYPYLSMKVTSSAVEHYEFRAQDTNGNFATYRYIDIPAGTSVINVDLSSAPSFPSSGAWTGQVTGIRIDPGAIAGTSFCIDWVSIGSSALATEPTLDAYASRAGGKLIINPRGIVTLAQPDKRGGRDFFIDVKGNASNMDSTSDIANLSNLSSASIKPGNNYTDNAGNQATADFLELKSIGDGSSASGDSGVVMVEPGGSSPLINADLYKIACYSIHHPSFSRSQYQSVVRLFWDKPGGGYYSGDDAFPGIEDDPVRRGRNKETEICLDLPSMPIETNGTDTVYGDFWKGTLNYFRLDPHEESTPSITSILKNVRLASYHLADQTFALVVQGSRAHDVSLYYSTAKGTTGGQLITTLSSGRSSDVYVWDVSGLPNNTYYLYSTADGMSFQAPSPIVVDHTGFATDTEAPQLGLFAPASDGSGNYCSLDLSGYAVDNRRIATIEVFVDNVRVHSFTPYKFLKSVRDQFPNYPYSSEAGFQESIDISAFGSGTRQLKVNAWDTAGNKTTVEVPFTRECSSPTPPYQWPTYDEPSLPVTIPTVVSYSPSLKLSKFKGKGLQAEIKGAICNLQIRASATKNNLTTATIIGSKNLTKTSQKVTLKTKTLKPVKGANKFFVQGFCSNGTGKTAARSFAADKGGKIKIDAMLKKLKIK